MVRTVYFADKAVVFTSENPVGGEDYVLPADDCAALNRDKIVKILETHNRVFVLSPDPDEAFDRFAAQFTRVEAAGGVVVNSRGEWLMMRRNGRWDLPKGHVECGESDAACAEREIAEETGVAARVVRPLCHTWHAYRFPASGRWELKRTKWFALSALSSSGLTPQTEEGIEAVAWCAPDRVARHAPDCFPTVRRVLECLHASCER